MKFLLSKLFPVGDSSDHSIDEKNDCIEEKKAKFSREGIIVEDFFYIHKKPKPSNGEIKMGIEIETPDEVNNPQLLIKDENTGAERPMTREEAASIMRRNVPPGINVPGIGNTSAAANAKARGAQPKRKKAPAKSATINMEKKSSGEHFPPTQMAMVEGAYHVFIDLPGVLKENLIVTYDKGYLNVAGTRENPIEELRKKIKKGKKTRKDPILDANSSVPGYMLGKFVFRYPFNRMINELEMGAKFENGQLHITLPHMGKGKETAIPIM